MDDDDVEILHSHDEYVTQQRTIQRLMIDVQIKDQDSRKLRQETEKLQQEISLSIQRFASLEKSYESRTESLEKSNLQLLKKLDGQSSQFVEEQSQLHVKIGEQSKDLQKLQRQLSQSQSYVTEQQNEIQTLKNKMVQMLTHLETLQKETIEQKLRIEETEKKLSESLREFHMLNLRYNGKIDREQKILDENLLLNDKNTVLEQKLKETVKQYDEIQTKQIQSAEMSQQSLIEKLEENLKTASQQNLKLENKLHDIMQELKLCQDMNQSLTNDNQQSKQEFLIKESECILSVNKLHSATQLIEKFELLLQDVNKEKINLQDQIQVSQNNQQLLGQQFKQLAEKYAKLKTSSEEYREMNQELLTMFSDLKSSASLKEIEQTNKITMHEKQLVQFQQRLDQLRQKSISQENEMQRQQQENKLLREKIQKINNQNEMLIEEMNQFKRPSHQSDQDEVKILKEQLSLMEIQYKKQLKEQKDQLDQFNEILHLQ